MVDDMGIGARIGALRTRRGLTQEERAGLAGISVSLLRKIEQGVRPVTKFVRLLDIAQALRVRDLAELTGVPLPLMPNGHRTHPGVPAVRDALTAYSVPAVDRPPDLIDLASRIETAWTRWQRPGAFRLAQTGQDLPALISAVRAALSVVDGPERTQALAEASKLYQLVRGWCKRVGEHDLAWIAGDRAITLARDTGDVDQVAAAGWCMVATLGGKGHVDQAREVARQAIDELRPWMTDPPVHRVSLWGALHLHTSWTASLVDDERTVDAALEEAERAAAVTGERNDFRTVFGPTNVAVHRANALVELGKAGAALRVGEQVRIDQAPSVERRFSHHVALARAYTQRREDVAAVTMLRRVEQESREEVQVSSLVRETIRELVARETPATSAELRPLARLAGVID